MKRPVRPGRDRTTGGGWWSSPDPGMVDLAGRRVLVVGYGRVGKLVGDMLTRHDLAWSAVDRDPRLVGTLAAILADVAQRQGIGRDQCLIRLFLMMVCPTTNRSCSGSLITKRWSG